MEENGINLAPVTPSEQGGLRMNGFKILYGIGFVCSIGCLFYAYRHFQDGNSTRALVFLVNGIVCGIVNFKALMKE